MTDIEFERRNREFIEAMAADPELRAATQRWFEASYEHEYSYHFRWMGLPIIQYPQDMVAVQELVWDLRPDVIVETGIARGGSLVFYASLMEMMGISGKVVGIDIDIRTPNREAIERHPMAGRITMIEGSSTDDDVIDRVRAIVGDAATVMVILDSNHTHHHVLSELRLYSPFVTRGSYLVVFDTIVELMPEGTYPDRPWGKGDNPMSAVAEFLATSSDFVVDPSIPDKLLITAAPGGFLRRVGPDAG